MKRFATLRAVSRIGNKLLPLILAIVALPAAAQVSVTATGGTPGPTVYTTLKAAFDAINAGTHQSAITVTVTGNTTEATSAVLNASGAGGASYSAVTIKPGASATPTISGSINSGPVVKLNGASNVTIDGSNNGTGSRNLTISNTSITTPQVLVAGSVGTTPFSNVTIKNSVLINGANTSTALIFSDAASAGTAGYFNNVTLQNNSIQKAYIGVYAITVPASGNGDNTLIDGNDLNATGANAIRLCGLYVQGLSGATVSNNNVGNFESASAEYDRAIWLATGTANTNVTDNTVSGLSYTGSAGYAPIGINISPGIASANITVSGNTISNISSASTATSIGIYFYSAASGATIQKNKISNIKNTNTGGYGAAGILLAGSLTASAVNVLNNFVSDVAAYGTNQWTSDANGNGIVVDGGGGYNIYANTVWMNTSQTATTGTRAACLLITSNVTTANSINLRNNVLVNTQTVGNANSRMAMVITASTNVFNTCNYNDYYSASTNLVGQGTNATIWNTIAQVQSNIGLNSASISFLPTFVSSTDLHLVATSVNNALNNTGVAIAAVTTDIDGDTRATPPDIGADEFNICTAVTAGANPASANICTPANASFTASATGATSYQWQVNTGSGFNNVTNGGVYGGATTATLSLTAPPATMNGYQYRLVSGTVAGCPTVNSAAATLTVNQTPSVVVTASGPVALCTGGSVTLSVPSVTGYNYQWKESGTAIGGATAASYTTGTAGSYTVTVTNPNGNCSATSSPAIDVTVGSGPTAVITPVGPTGFCTGSSVTLSAGNTAGVTYQWKRNNTDVGSGNSYAAATAGSYTVLVTSGPGCATLSAPVVVSEYALPAASITPSGTAAFCQGGSVVLTGNSGGGLSRQWIRDGNDLSGANGLTYAASVVGNYTLRVTNTATGCQRVSAAVVVTQNPLPAAAISPATFAPICEGDSVLMTANTGAGLGYQWKLNTNILTGATAGNYYAKAGGSYTVLVTDANGCQRTSAAASLTVNPAPPSFITYNSPLAFCEGSAVVLSANDGSGLQYQWQRNGSPIAGQTNLSYLAAQSGAYTIVTRNNFNCTKTSDAVNVTVYSRPLPVIAGVNAVLHAGPGYTQYQWFRHNVAISGATDSIYTATQSGLYKVYVVDVHGCDNTSPQYNLSGLGLAQTAASSSIKVYPNPARDVVTIEQTGASRISGLTVLNGLGAVVERVAVSAGSNHIVLSTAHLAAGIYTLRVQLEDGSVALRKLELIGQ